LVDDGVLLLTIAALVAATLILIFTRSWRSALHVGLDLLTAAGLLRLSSTPSYQALGVAATVILVRQLASRGLTSLSRV
jgi:hypothetical protein